MKKLFILIASTFILFGCSKTFYSESVSVIDYREYINEGFTISPTVTGFNYQPISNIEVSFLMGDLKKGEDGKGLLEYVPYKGYKSTNKIYYPSGKRMMDKMVTEAKNMGANGLINFKVTINAGKWVASGIAVKIQ